MTTSHLQLHPMERVLYQIHHKVCTFALRHTTTQARKLLERLWLLFFVAGFGVTMILHVSFVYRDTTTLDGRPLMNSIPLMCLPNVPGFVSNADVTHVYLLSSPPPQQQDSDSRRVHPAEAITTSWAFLVPPEESASHDRNTAFCSSRSGNDQTRNHEENVCDNRTPPLDGTSAGLSWDARSAALVSSNNDIYFSYSPVKGYLYLTPEQCLQHNISVQHVLISPTDEHCLGEPFLQRLIFYMTAYDTVMINWLLGTFGAQGYIYNPRSQTLLDPASYAHLQQQQPQQQPLTPPQQQPQQQPLTPPQEYHHHHKTVVSKLTVVCKTTFLFFIVTTLVAFILRETQERMLEFTRQLQVRVRSHRPVAHLVTTHVVENLVFVPIMVGMIFFLIEFYDGDKVAAFMVLSIVWVCEAFSVVSLRSSEGIYFFPRIFFLEFSMFHYYFFMFPCGFSYLALASTACCMLHSMLFFWHRYELPAVALGHVTSDFPRMGAPAVAASNGTYNNYMPSPARHTSAGHESSPTPLRSNRHSNDDDDDTYDGVPLPPMARLPPRPSIARQHSLGAFSTSSRMSSRYPSSTGLFRPGDDGDDEDSAIYFMDGEVVMLHQTHVATSANSRTGRSHDSSTDGDSQQQQGGGHHPHDRMMMIPASISTEQPPAQQQEQLPHEDNNSHHHPDSSQSDHDSLFMTETTTATTPTNHHNNHTTPRVDNRNDCFVNGDSGPSCPVLED